MYRLFQCRAVPFVLFTACILLLAQCPAHAASATILNRTAASKLMPATVFFRGQTATTQERNSCGVHFADGKYMLAALVDTSGYATGLKQRYQGYLLTEASLDFGGHHLAPGAYGFGFLTGHQFVILDVGGNQLFETKWHPFHGPRPVPLNIRAAGSGYELCSGRQCVNFH